MARGPDCACHKISWGLLCRVPARRSTRCRPGGHAADAPHRHTRTTPCPRFKRLPSVLPPLALAHAGLPRRWPLLIAGGAAGAAQAQSRAFSPGWFADKGAAQSAVQRSGRLPDGSLAGVGNASQQQAQSRQQLQRSLDNLNRTAAAVAAQQAAQAAARRRRPPTAPACRTD